MSTQPYQLMQFLHNITVVNGSIVPKSNYTPTTSMQELYLMDTSVSNFSKNVYSLIGDNEFTYDYSDAIDGMIPFFNKLIGNLTYRPIYTLFQSIILESFSMVYMIESGYATTNGFNSSDMDRVHTNIQRVIDALYYINLEGVYDVIIQLRELDSNLLYMFSTFSGISYTLSSSYDNKTGKSNGFVDSEFNDIDTFYRASHDDTQVTPSSVLRKISDNNSSSLVYYGDYDTIVVSTTPIPVYSNSTFSLRANTSNKMSIVAVDGSGNPISKFVDKDGNIIRDGVIAQTSEYPKGVQIVQGVYVPSGITYVSIQFTIGKQTGIISDRISEPILVVGYHIGEYVAGMTELGE